MAVKNNTVGKRKAAARQVKSSASAKTKKGKATGHGKEHAYDKPIIPIPKYYAESDPEISEEELEFLAEDVEAAHGFLRKLDEQGIIRSKKEQDRLHKLSKPQLRVIREDDLPSIDSHNEDEHSWSSGINQDIDKLSVPDEASDAFLSSVIPKRRSKPARKMSDDEEMPYETIPRKRKKSWDSDEEGQEAISRLPIKLQNGRVLRSDQKLVLQHQERTVESSSESEDSEASQAATTREDVSTGARFGRPAVVDVISTKSRPARIQTAKEQIANVCQDIVADPENSLGLLRRLHSFCLQQISTPSHPEPVPNDVLIRRLAFLSQLAVFKDIVPGYRIRPLTDKEKAEKVSQMVQRTRDFEQGLVNIYQSYLRVLEEELKTKSEHAETALQCICRLLVDLTHFNFRQNLLTAVVVRLSKKTWDESSDLCLKTLSSVFRNDALGQASLEAVRLLNRMIRERNFNVHPNVMLCLLDLRLRMELGGVRASPTKADKETPGDGMSKAKAAARRAKGKPTAQPHLSKKARKKMKEVQVIQKEMREANTEIDHEGRAARQTETLKLLFVLYFRILKNDEPTPLIPAALQGISRFAHLVNIDFFRDLLQVLHGHVSREVGAEEAMTEPEEGNNSTLIPGRQDVHIRLHCIITAFELLSGQGEALNIDLTDFVNSLYAMLTPLSTAVGTEEPLVGTTAPRKTSSISCGDAPANMLFRALNLVFSPRSVSAKNPPWRTAAFAKRLLTATLHFPPATAVRALKFVGELLAKEPRLDSLLTVEDRVANGVYRPDIDDPQLCNPFAATFWELRVLSEKHVDRQVRRLAKELVHFSRDQC